MARVSKGRVAVAAAACSVTLIINIILSHDLVRTNRAGLELIGNAEGCRRDPYTCPAGIITDGIGNTHGVKPGTRKTDQQIAQDWEKNIQAAEECVNQYADGKSLSDDTFSAVTSITFNAGCAAMKKSTLFALLRQSEIRQACDQFPRWVYGGGKLLPGLVHRRDQEKALCLKGLDE
ncbi:lysozyme [Pantoea sp. Bo_2]|uniref:lysozyme n=1 Tax=unclassified Pantoea TaxID=2630326 RepID=UPI001232B6D9|nr:MULTISPECIES: lysozyme [unclassified Pantoea]KAA5935359.1 lysozyme [Pantoea sp. VH_3]KAA5944901.1 lysozyme [Pantoea sp. VH_25]KAA5976634.1 lysozyme [Pantoea sp. M_3]KAA6039314.1 lysozyme [Pantoea sp. FN_2b]KAA6044181.1 lysozyme [Pantoea sp. Bo_5]